MALRELACIKGGTSGNKARKNIKVTGLEYTVYLSEQYHEFDLSFQCFWGRESSEPGNLS